MALLAKTHLNLESVTEYVKRHHKSEKIDNLVVELLQPSKSIEELIWFVFASKDGSHDYLRCDTCGETTCDSSHPRHAKNSGNPTPEYVAQHLGAITNLRL